jgi:uncharacterized protein YndB with AHSA1/START domain
MTDLVLERLLPAAIDRVFDFVTRRQNVLTWWGPEGATVPDERLDFSRPGPWHSVFQNSDGRRYKVSGQVTRVEKPNLVAFTWGWHDDKDNRGPESHVMIEISEAGPDRTRLIVRHADLPDDPDSRGAHDRGWAGALTKLERLLSA